MIPQHELHPLPKRPLPPLLPRAPQPHPQGAAQQVPPALLPGASEGTIRDHFQPRHFTGNAGDGPGRPPAWLGGMAGRASRFPQPDTVESQDVQKTWLR